MLVVYCIGCWVMWLCRCCCVLFGLVFFMVLVYGCCVSMWCVLGWCRILLFLIVLMWKILWDCNVRFWVLLRRLSVFC